ncbi:hypothetical protein PIB30_032903 [Stylosanthes scabra]|uniref:Uncharacterized protein n=1 Tax=Stylosanthes scabra TaxID=79078 RepID=A0ABU6UB32_9FABA|nr:hypothetical protein [Stylosanthes scabra]
MKVGAADDNQEDVTRLDVVGSKRELGANQDKGRKGEAANKRIKKSMPTMTATQDLHQKQCNCSTDHGDSEWSIVLRRGNNRGIDRWNANEGPPAEAGTQAELGSLEGEAGGAGGEKNQLRKKIRNTGKKHSLMEVVSKRHDAGKPSGGSRRVTGEDKMDDVTGSGRASWAKRKRTTLRTKTNWMTTRRQHGDRTGSGSKKHVPSVEANGSPRTLPATQGDTAKNTRKHPATQSISERNKQHKKQQKFPHRMGLINFGRIQAALHKEKGTNEDPKRFEMFIVTRTSQKRKEIDETTQRAIIRLNCIFIIYIHVGTAVNL